MKQLLAIYIMICFSLVWSQDDDMDAMWDNTIWNEIEDIADEDVQEVDNITAVAGVRGAEAEDEALHHLYYRQSMKGPSEIELNKALGKLLNSLATLKGKNPKHEKIPEITHYIIQVYKKLNNKSKQIELQKELLATAPNSKWAKFYK